MKRERTVRKENRRRPLLWCAVVRRSLGGGAFVGLWRRERSKEPRLVVDADLGKYLVDDGTQVAQGSTLTATGTGQQELELLRFGISMCPVLLLLLLHATTTVSRHWYAYSVQRLASVSLSALHPTAFSLFSSSDIVRPPVIFFSCSCVLCHRELCSSVIALSQHAQTRRIQVSFSTERQPDRSPHVP